MKIAVIGTGYVGLPTGAGFASLGHKVVCVDKDADKVEKLNQGIPTIFERGLTRLLKYALSENNIRFTTDLADAVKDAELIIIAVGTPTANNSKQADLSFIYAVAEELKTCMPQHYTVVATKSTVPIKTGDKIEEILQGCNCDVISLPEFLREGFAVDDFFYPDRIVCGTNSQQARHLIGKLYSAKNVLYVSRKSAELIKYASNAFLAMKIHYINEIADVCEQTGADVMEVAKGMGLDTRIGDKFLNAGIGYGGSCFPKDTLAMSYIGEEYGVNLSLVNATIEGNNNRINKFADKILKEGVGAKIAVLGLAFKNNTDDCRQSPAMQIVQKISQLNQVNVYDPQAMENAKTMLNNVNYCENIYEAVTGADICVILTEWTQFRDMDLKKVYKLMNNKILLDFRNVIDKQKALDIGFKYKGVGR
jgi:UDPglucose 6-dehydrogenase